ncbi:MAG: AIPR family protein [Reyranella sp.]|nr:AIPR family protein [Reyranella sp.]
MDRELLAFAQRFNSDVHDQALAGEDDGSDVYSENIFTELVLEHLGSIGMIEGAEVCHYEGTYGRAILKISGYSLAEDKERLDLFITIFVDTAEPRSIPREDINRAADRAVRFLEASAGGLHDQLEPSGEAFEIARAIHSSIGSIELVRVFVLTDGLISLKKLEPRETLGTPVKFEIWDIERLYRGMLAGVPRDEIDVNFVSMYGQAIPCLPAPDEGADFKTYLTVLPGELLYKLYDEYGSRLLELNVRSFLGVRGSKTVNSGIRKTLKDEPARFMAYNNGIVVTADTLDIEVLSDGRAAIRSAKGLQIVNGGQTTASIHRAKDHDELDISAVYVPTKIITVVDADKLDKMVQMISHYANSQNTVQPADFSANHPYHVKLEELSSTVWCPDGHSRWFYERARGSYQVALSREGATPAAARRFKERMPPQRRFTKPEVAKYLNAWEQKPHLVSYGAQKNFDNFMQSIHTSKSEDWLPDQTYYRQLIAKAIVFRAAQKIVRAEKFPAHQANITAYLVAYLSWRTSQAVDLEGIWQSQKVSDQLQQVLREWAHKIDQYLRETAQGRMVTEWSKREACWEKVRDLQLELPEPLPPELSERRVTATGSGTARTKPYDEKLSAEDYRNIEVCKTIDGGTWLRVHAWGKKSGELKNWQSGIAHTLAGYAASDWDKGPSPKQARHAIVILKAAEAAGVIPKKFDEPERP